MHKPYHHGNLRESLLQAAEALLEARGAAALTLREVAKAAGVSHAAPYHHFESLEALSAAVAERGFAALADEMAAARGADVREHLLGICEAYVRFALRRPEQFRLMFGPLLAHKQKHPQLQQSAERSFGVLLQAAQEFSPAEGVELALCGWSLAHGYAHLAIDRVIETLPVPVPDADTLARRFAARLLGETTATSADARPRYRRPGSRS